MIYMDANSSGVTLYDSQNSPQELYSNLDRVAWAGWCNGSTIHKKQEIRDSSPGTGNNFSILRKAYIRAEFKITSSSRHCWPRLSHSSTVIRRISLRVVGGSSRS